MSSAPPVIALLGFGEAGSAFGRDLLRGGVPVRVYDPEVVAGPPALAAESEADAARGVDLVLSVNSAHDAIGALAAGLPGVGPNTVWADMNTASPKTKQRLAAMAREHGIPFVDIAIMAPVPGRGLSVPMLVSGSAAERVASLLGRLGATIDVQPGEAGAAAERKLLRSVFFKGLAAAVFEALEAGRAAGCEPWLHDHIADELVAVDASTVERLVTGTVTHARRRADEMAAAAEMLADLEVEPTVTGACRDLLRRIAQE